MEAMEAMEGAGAGAVLVLVVQVGWDLCWEVTSQVCRNVSTKHQQSIETSCHR
jgi:hypothetical protein